MKHLILLTKPAFKKKEISFTIPSGVYGSTNSLTIPAILGKNGNIQNQTMSLIAKTGRSGDLIF